MAKPYQHKPCRACGGGPAERSRMNDSNEWRPVVGFESSHEVSSDGLVRKRGKEPLKQWLNGRGTQYARVSINGRAFTVHCLVLSAFAGPRPQGMQACHNNGVSTDNRRENLRWDTPKSNIRDRDMAGHGPRGERNPRARLTAPQVKAIFRSKERTDVLACKFCVSDVSIRNIRRGATWAHLL